MKLGSRVMKKKERKRSAVALNMDQLNLSLWRHQKTQVTRRVFTCYFQTMTLSSSVGLETPKSSLFRQDATF